MSEHAVLPDGRNSRLHESIRDHTSTEYWNCAGPRERGFADEHKMDCAHEQERSSSGGESARGCSASESETDSSGREHETSCCGEHGTSFVGACERDFSSSFD